MPLVSCSAKCNTQSSGASAQRSSVLRGKALRGNATAALLLAFVLGLLVSGCGRKGLNGTDSPTGGSGKAGKSISIKASTANVASTKTVYAGNTRTTGDTEYIYWVANDQITITCPQDYYKAYSADYKLTPVGGNATKALVTPVSNDLYWNHSAGTHYFYGLYPAAKSIKDSDAKAATSLTKDGLFTGYIPASQLTDGKSTIAASGSEPMITVYAPVMQNLPMWSGSSAAKESDGVSLIFRPAATTFEFTLNTKTSEEFEIVSISISSLTDATVAAPYIALSGPFTGKIAQGGASISYKSVDGGNIPAATTTNNSVTVTLDSDAKVTDAKAVRATLFTLPASRLSGNESTLSNIKLTVNMKQGSATFSRSLFLKDKTTKEPIAFTGTKKYLLNLVVPTLKDCTFRVINVDPLTATASDITAKNVEVVELDDSDGDEILLW